MMELSHKWIGLAAILVLAAGVFPVQAQEAEKDAADEAEPQTESEPVEQTESVEATGSADDTVAVETRQTITGSRINRTVSDEDTHGSQRIDTFAPVDVYSREELTRTGEIDLGRALRRLDPSIRGRF